MTHDISIFYSVRKRWSSNVARFLTLLWATNSRSWQAKKMWKWWKRIKICITTVLNVLPTSAQQIKGRISFPLHNNRLQHQKKKEKVFSKCNTKRLGDKIHFCTSSFETSIKCDPRVRGIMNSYTWVYIQIFAGNIWCKWLEFQFLEEIFAASYLYIQERSNIFVPKTFSASKQNQPQTISSLW